MKQLLFVFFCLPAFSGFGQFNKPVSVSPTINFDAVLQGLATNLGGVGGSIDAFFLAQQRWGVLLEASGNWFAGDKLYVFDPATGKQAKPAAVRTLSAGPDFFVSPNVLLSLTAGPAWHTVRAFRVNTDLGLKFHWMLFFGKQKRITTKAFFTAIPLKENDIHFLGIGTGYRF